MHQLALYPMGGRHQWAAGGGNDSGSPTVRHGGGGSQRSKIAVSD